MTKTTQFCNRATVQNAQDDLVTKSSGPENAGASEDAENMRLLGSIFDSLDVLNAKIKRLDLGIQKYLLKHNIYDRTQ